MKLSEMTDNEINFAIKLEELKKHFPNAKYFEPDDPQKCIWVHDVGFSSHQVLDCCGKALYYMQIATENNIDIKFYTDDVQCKHENFDIKFTSRFMPKSDAGRAVCECFLMTKGHV